ncbi:MAG: hypothetical protein KF824_01850 [Fimbriimonadaceae bacterium]|nr:MAG: hypothetical protein KF824_01850 [Fimbriimonadaceae bacterium]
MIPKALLVWLLLSVLAVLNGLFREAVVRPKLGERLGHVFSTLLLTLVILFVASLTQSWIGVRSLSDAWMVGAIWLVMTLAFEFLAGHYLFKNPWSKIFADYNTFNGRIWILIPIITVTAIPLAFTGWRQEHIIPFLICQSIGVVSLTLAVTKPHIARWVLIVIFLAAAILNARLALTQPAVYQDFAEFVIVPIYREIITEPFKLYATPTVLGIAFCQLVIAVLFALGRKSMPVAVIGACLFFAGIAPFGIGSAFPLSALLSLAALAAYGGLHHIEQKSSSA